MVQLGPLGVGAVVGGVVVVVAAVLDTVGEAALEPPLPPPQLARMSTATTRVGAPTHRRGRRVRGLPIPASLMREAARAVRTLLISL
jgi:hypothetical protein